MGMHFQKRTRLWKKRRSEAWVNWSIGIPSVSLRLGPVVFNTKRGLSSVRTPVRGLTYRDED